MSWSTSPPSPKTGRWSLTRLALAPAAAANTNAATPATDATRPLIMWVDFGQDLSPVNGTISLAWDAIGMGYVAT